MFRGKFLLFVALLIVSIRAHADSCTSSSQFSATLSCPTMKIGQTATCTAKVVNNGPTCDIDVEVGDIYFAAFVPANLVTLSNMVSPGYADTCQSFTDIDPQRPYTYVECYENQTTPFPAGSTYTATVDVTPKANVPHVLPMGFALAIAQAPPDLPNDFVETQTDAAVETPAAITVASLPSAMLTTAGGTTSATFVVKNAGGTPAAVTLSPSGNFFTVSPQSFTVDADGTQTITITSLAVGAGAYDGSISLSGTGVPAGLSVPVHLLVAVPSSGAPAAVSQQPRVDVRSVAGSNATGTVVFTNNGTGTLTGILSADVPWIIPQPGVITIAPGQSVTLSFQIDDSKRPDVVGSLTGTLSLNYLTSGAGGSSSMRVLDTTTHASATPVTIVSTRPPQTANGVIPDLAPGEVALFLPGVGHVTGSVGVFLTDVTLANIAGSGTLDAVKLYYSSPASTTTQVSTLQVTAGHAVALADTTKTVFNADGQVGTLQVRAPDVEQLAASAVVFNSSNPRGTYGSSVPVFRSDRSLAPGQQMFITGIRQRAGTHTNYYLQETAGLSARVVTEAFDKDGKSLGSRTDSLGRFALSQLGSVFPAGTVSAIVTNAADSAGRVVAYVTPVDEGSGDTWAITDWAQQSGYLRDEPIIVANVGAVHGANSTYFRSDLAIFNTGNAPAAATLRYYPRGAAPIDKDISLGPEQSFISDDVVTSLFQLRTDSSGYIVLTPSSGTFSVTSRTYTTPAGTNATLGTAVPALAVSQSLGNASLVRRIAGLEDAALSSIVAARPATFRTNFGIVETSGDRAVVRVTVTYAPPGNGHAETTATQSKNYVLEPYQFLPVSGLTRDVIGAARDAAYGDLHDVQVDFQVLSGTAIVYTTSVDNGTGDSVMRVE